MGLSCPITILGTVEGRVQAGGAGKPPRQHETVMDGGDNSPCPGLKRRSGVWLLR